MTFKKAANIVKKFKEKEKKEKKNLKFFLSLSITIVFNCFFGLLFFFGMKATYIYFLTEFFFCEF